jgi:hypothetical protein
MQGRPAQGLGVQEVQRRLVPVQPRRGGWLPERLPPAPPAGVPGGGFVGHLPVLGRVKGQALEVHLPAAEPVF